MIGLACYAAATVSAFLVAQRRPEHRPVANALLAATTYSLMAALAAPPRLALAYLVLLPATTASAYLALWSRSPPWPPLAIGAALALWIWFAPDARIWWSAVTWGPFLACSALGLTLWLRRRLWTTITERVVLAVLIGDILGLALVPIPGAVEAEGRAMAVLVTLAHAGWLVTQRGSRSPAEWPSALPARAQLRQQRDPESP